MLKRILKRLWANLGLSEPAGPPKCYFCGGDNEVVYETLEDIDYEVTLYRLDGLKEVSIRTAWAGSYMCRYCKEPEDKVKTLEVS